MTRANGSEEGAHLPPAHVPQLECSGFLPLIKLQLHHIRRRIGIQRPPRFDWAVKTFDAVDIVTDPVLVEVFEAVATADANGVELVAVAIAIFFRDVVAPTLKDGTGTVANATFVELTNTFVHIVANAVSVRIGHAAVESIAILVNAVNRGVWCPCVNGGIVVVAIAL